MFRNICLSALAMVLCSSCAGGISTSTPVTGIWYTNAMGATTATSNTMGSKVGESCAVSYLGLIGLGDASVSTAAKTAGITKVSAVDSRNTSILGVIAKNCTVVTGE